MKTATTNGTPLSIFEPANLSTGKHPVLLEFQGQSQWGNMGFDGNSVSGQLNAGGKLPAVYADAIVINVHQPKSGIGIYEPQRFKDAYAYVVANYPTADLSRVAICGLSLGGGGVLGITHDVEFCKLLCAMVPVAPTGDADLRGTFFPDLKASKIPYLIYGSSTDDNAPTRSAFQIIQFFYPQMADKAQGSMIDTLTGHGGTWAKAYSFTGTGSMWNWLAAQTRAVVVTPPVVVVTPVRKLVASKTTTYKTWLEPDGTYTVEIS